MQKQVCFIDGSFFSGCSKQYPWIAEKTKKNALYPWGRNIMVSKRFFLLRLVTSVTKKLLKLIADNIQNYLSHYFKELTTFKSNRCSITGYIRKPQPWAGETEDDRGRLLNLMVQWFRERSHVEKTFASSKSDSKDTLMKRDIPRPTIMCKVKGVHSTM